MIISRIQGGIGNQMFQWAFAKTLSRKFNQDLFLELSFYRNQSQNNVYRTFELNKFKLPIKTSLEINLNSDLRFLRITDTYEYKSYSLDNGSNYFLDGYWQSEKYFSDFSSQILEDFSPEFSKCEELNKYLQGKTISLHVRRTDYLKSNGFHPIQSIDYYNQAIEIIGDYDRLIIFSDDIKWCKENMNYSKMSFCEVEDDIDQLWLMSLCQDNIISNSTFSWWGAWLNTNKNKKVISPNKWFGQHVNINHSDIIPKNWIKI